MADIYVVTGGAGFIGSNVVRDLVQQGKEVRVVDNLSTSSPENLADVAESVTFYEADITNIKELHDAFDGATYVLHQAALPSVPRSIADPVTSNNNNIDGTLNVLLAARDQKVKRVVFAGSSSVYGNATAEYKSEDLPVNPLSPYALTKYAGEVYCRQFYELYGLETIVLRYFNVFGPYQDPNGAYAAVIPKFITAMLRGEAPTIYGDGEQSRDFTFVANNVAANILAATSREGAGQVFNIACGTQMSLNKLVDIINDELGTSLKPNYQDDRVGDIKHSQADISKAKKVLGYTPKVSTIDGLKQTIAWYKHQAA